MLETPERQIRARRATEPQGQFFAQLSALFENSILYFLAQVELVSIMECVNNDAHKYAALRRPDYDEPFYPYSAQ